MHCGNTFYGFQFDQNQSFDQQVRSETLVEPQAAEFDGNSFLAFDTQTSLLQHLGQYHFIH